MWLGKKRNKKIKNEQPKTKHNKMQKVLKKLKRSF